ncbi:MAG TPA: LamG domain-containing protein [Steroidobacteraceae bacterium]|nr:LamG domain-containing protein [Steroidobacteraceae bacterium]
MYREHPMNRFGLLAAGARTLQALAALALVTLVTACAGGSGGAATVVNQATSNTSTANAYTGPAAATADVTAFQVNLWQNIRVQNRCGGCHHAGGQSPMFARSDDVNLAYQAALPLINATNPSQSTMVLKVGGGHNCWVADPNACAQTLLTWINNWLGGGSASATSITLVAPPVQTVGAYKTFPTDSSGFQQYLWTPILTVYCSNCHTPTSATAQSPYFADTNPTDLPQTYLAAQPKINLNAPEQSRFYERLANESHHCWPSTPNGVPDCAASAAYMLKQLQAYANSITAAPVDPTLVVSKALGLTQGVIASGGSRYEANIVAKYMFETGTGNLAYDTSGVSPSADLTLNSNVSWAGGWGLTFAAGGKAQASTSSSQKIAQLAQGTGEYSFEAWVNPANVTQTEAYIMTYSGSDTTRNATLAQSAQSYEGRTRSSATDTNGSPPMISATAENAAQAALTHVVLTYDPVNGQILYVNGRPLPDKDPAAGGSLANWDSTFALALGSEVTGKEGWTGTIKFAAIHSRALTPAQVLQNFNAGVGQAYFLLFDVSSLSGIAQTYIMFKASQYDTYSYLFTNPTFISLNPSAAPANLVIKGMRIGVNGQIPSNGQSYATLNATVGPPAYSSTNGQVLSTVGAVIPLNQSVATDMFFLSFDQFGTFTHTTTPVIYPAPQPTVSSTVSDPDMGIATFERIYHSMAQITGVPFTDSVVTSAYNTLQQSMPSAPQINAFLPSHQTAISQMAGAYCQELVGNTTYRDKFFGTTLDASLASAASGFFGTTGSGNATNVGYVVTPLVNAIVGTAYPQAASAMSTELNNLILRIPSLSSAAKVSDATIAACNAALGSAAATVQ